MTLDKDPQPSNRYTTESRFRLRTRSASMPLARNSIDSGSKERRTGSSESGRQIPLMQITSPLRTGGEDDNLLQTRRNVTVVDIDDSLEEMQSLNDKDRSVCSLDNTTAENEHLLSSVHLSICNEPRCSTCNNLEETQQINSESSGIFGRKVPSLLHMNDILFYHNYYRDAMGWVRRSFSFMHMYVPRVIDPRDKAVQKWNKLILLSCLLAVIVDPLFLFSQSIQMEYRCIVFNWPTTITFVVIRSVSDFIFFLHMLLQFRLAYEPSNSRRRGDGNLVQNPKEIFRHYILGYFLIDLFVVLPLPQILILFVLPRILITHTSNANTIRIAVLLQYFPRLIRFLPLLAAETPSGFIFESAWDNFSINMLTFALCGHVVGSCWYFFGLQRVYHCLRDACQSAGIHNCIMYCETEIGSDMVLPHPIYDEWAEFPAGASCFDTDSFHYGIFELVVRLSTETHFIGKYVYSLFWGFQQISTLAGNQTPSIFVGEVIFLMAIVGTGLCFIAFIIGNMQNYLQVRGQRRLEMSLRNRDVQQWMRHRDMPVELRGRIDQAVRYHWTVNKGVNEEMLLGSLPEDIQRETRRHIFKIIKNVRIFSSLDEPILDSIYERVRQEIYIKGSKIMDHGVVVERIVFIVHGTMESVGEDGNAVCLQEGDICGEELLTWFLEQFLANKDATSLGQNLISKRMVRCLTNVEAYSLHTADMRELGQRFARFIENRSARTLRDEAPKQRSSPSRRVQVAWRHRKKRHNRPDASS